MRNVEIKARVHDYDEIIKRAELLSGSTGTIIKQDDTFYNVKYGRLKLRFFEDGAAKIVSYDREDTSGPKMSVYDLIEFGTAENKKAKRLNEFLVKCLGLKGRVIKERKLFMVDQTRIHIDQVEGLGNFMELEVVLRPEQTLEDGQVIAKDLQTKLGVKDEDLIDCAYVDMMK